MVHMDMAHTVAAVMEATVRTDRTVVGLRARRIFSVGKINPDHLQQSLCWKINI
jgi:hypothetical protein